MSTNRYAWPHVTFDLTHDHLKLLQRMNVGWCDDEFGAPEIDPKRPYGNSDVLRDMVELLMPNVPWDSESYDPPGGLPESTIAALNAIHKEMETALQVVLAAQSFEPGRYTAEKYSTKWRRVPE